jgi:hypothetical protein
MGRLVPIKRDDGSYTLFIILDDSGLDRLKDHDPSHLEIHRMGEPWVSLKMNDCMIVYATQEELFQIDHCPTGKEIVELLKHMTRGWKHRPDLGDHDGDYLDVRTNNN